MKKKIEKGCLDGCIHWGAEDSKCKHPDYADILNAVMKLENKSSLGKCPAFKGRSGARRKKLEELSQSKAAIAMRKKLGIGEFRDG